MGINLWPRFGLEMGMLFCSRFSFVNLSASILILVPPSYIPNSSPRSSHLTSAIITTLIIHHPIILLFQPQNFFSQILPSISIWHLFRLISWMSGLLYGFFFVSVFLLVSFIVIIFIFLVFFYLRLLISLITVCFLIFWFFHFLVPFKAVLIFLLYLLR